jgi:hypothetical protein
MHVKRLAVVVLALASLAPVQAYGGIEQKAKNTAVNAAFGVIDCPKAWRDEASRKGARGVVGVLITGPVMCGTNVAVRYMGVAADLLTLPWGDNVVKPTALDHRAPLRLP